MNLFVASELKWPERGLTVRQDTTFPDEPRTRLRLTLAQPRQFAAARPAPGVGRRGRLPRHASTASRGRRDRRRRPTSRSIATGATAIGSRSSCRCGRDSSGCPTARTTPRSCTARSCSRRKTGTERLDGLIAGPGRMAHTSRRGRTCRSTPRRCWSATSTTLAARVEPVPGRPLTFRAPDAIRPAQRPRPRAGAVLPRPRQPLHDLLARRDAGGLRARRLRAARDASARGCGSRRGRSIASSPASSRARSTTASAATARPPASRTGVPSATPTGSFGYDLKRGDGARAAAAARHLSRQRARPPVRDPRGRSAGGDRRRSTAASRIGSPTSTYPIPADVVAADADGVLAIRFVAEAGSRAGAVYDVRLVRP